MKYYSDLIKSGRVPQQIKNAPTINEVETHIFQLFIDVSVYDPSISCILNYLDRSVHPHMVVYYFKVITRLLVVKRELEKR